MSSDLAMNLLLANEDLEDSWPVDCATELFTTSFPNFDQLRRSGQLCDITLVAQGVAFRAHKAVLAATIPYFNIMFTTDMLEAQQKTVTLTQIDPSTLEQVLNFVYTGKIRISTANVEKLMDAADYLQLSIITEQCSALMRNRISAANVLGIREFANLHNSTKTVESADRYIYKHFVSVSKSDEFLKLSVDRVVEILSKDELHVDSEEQVFEAGIRWLQHEADSRTMHSARVLSAVRMPLLKPSFISDQVTTNPLVRNSVQCRDLVDEAKDYHLIPERRSMMTSFKVKERFCNDVPGIIYAVGGMGSDSSRPSHVEMFDPLVGRWTQAKEMNSTRSRVGVAVLNRRLYVIGGYNGYERLRCVELPPLISKRSAVCAAAMTDQNQIYVCGGFDGATSLSSVESYDPSLNRWTIRPSMSSNRCAAAAAVLDGYLYVIGGHDGISIFSTAERFDPVTGKWDKIAPMNSRRCRLAAVSYEGKIYAIGGYNGTCFLNSVEIYDPETNTWTTGEPMNLRRARVSAVVNGQRIYAVGGFDGENNLSSIEIYEPRERKWKVGSPMLAHEGGVGVGVIPISAEELLDTNAGFDQCFFRKFGNFNLI
ncbi:Protein KEL-3 a [Aphelenchoides avenae]|nr:Protein KEL-3 a [Aphelenchus avenae]